MSVSIGFIGLRIMGNPMSRKLLEAGYSVTAWNRTRSRLDEIVAAGAAPAGSAAEVAAGSDITITMLTDSPVVEEVVLGGGGVIEGAQPDSVVIDMSTISPSVTPRSPRPWSAKACTCLTLR
jgi:3-hydroxyisobutyrate dehydrogenase-like beta-hydroxyacid dehydrogenase